MHEKREFEQVQGGKLRALAIMGARQFAGLPDVPAIVKSGILVGYHSPSFFTTLGYCKRHTFEGIESSPRGALCERNRR